jgi:hypothetical protein
MSEIDRILDKRVGDELLPCQAACPLHVKASAKGRRMVSQLLSQLLEGLRLNRCRYD